MRKVCPFFILLLLTLSVKSQIISDTLKIFIEERIEMKVIVNDFYDLKVDSNKVSIESYLNDFQKHLPELKSALNETSAEEIFYSGEGQIVLKEGEQQEVFIIGDAGLINSGSRDQAIIIHPLVRIELIAADISEVIDLPLNKYFESIVKQLPDKTPRSVNINYTIKDGEVKFLSEEANNKSAGDVLELCVGAGANLYQGQWLGEFQAKLDFKFFRKNVLQHNPYLSYSWLYDFKTSNKMNINGFLNIGYQWDLEAEKETTSLFGIEAGLLINRQGNLFEKNTWRLGLNWSPARSISVSPQMYIEGGFERVEPGVRITFGL